MTAFTLLVSCLVLLLIPLIVLCVYGYTHESAWRPMVYGALYQVLYLILFRLIMPMLFASQSWFIELTKSPAAVAMLYTVLQAVYLCAVFLLYDRHLLKKGGPQSFALLFGLTYGVMEGAIFSGFDSLNALMSAQSVIDAVNVSAVWLHLGEALCMIVLYAWLAWAFYIQLQAKKTMLWIGLCAAVLVFLFFAYGWSAIFGWDNAFRILLLLVAALLCGSALYPAYKAARKNGSADSKSNAAGV